MEKSKTKTLWQTKTVWQNILIRRGQADDTEERTLCVCHPQFREIWFTQCSIHLFVAKVKVIEQGVDLLMLGRLWGFLLLLYTRSESDVMG